MMWPIFQDGHNPEFYLSNRDQLQHSEILDFVKGYNKGGGGGNASGPGKSFQATGADGLVETECQANIPDFWQGQLESLSRPELSGLPLHKQWRKLLSDVEFESDYCFWVLLFPIPPSS